MHSGIMLTFLNRYQVMQLCWNLSPEERPTAAQVHALINHLHTTHALVRTRAADDAHGDLYASSDFEDRWQRLKPNSIPKVRSIMLLCPCTGNQVELFNVTQPRKGSRSSNPAISILITV